jgi:hypothetical protein
VPDARSNPLDTLLRQLADRAPSVRVRAWASRLLERGEAATGGTDAAHRERSQDSPDDGGAAREKQPRRSKQRCRSICTAPDAS